MKKTNALRILDSENIEYEVREYDNKKALSGIEVAGILNENPDYVFKTLVTAGKEDNFVFVIPVAKELDLKKAQHVSNEKRVEMLSLKELLPKTGYVHGGCSPVGMKKKFKTFIDISAKDKEYIYVSAGKIGMQVKIGVDDLLKVVDGELAFVTKE